jgi:hypothetical protein
MHLGRQLTFLSLVALCGCYTWTATERPVSGVKVTLPTTAEVTGNTQFTFAGSIIAIDAQKLTYGIQYRPFGYEQYSGPGRRAFQDTVEVPLNSESLRYSGLLFVPPSALPGRYLTYSFAQDARSRVSDSNLVFKMLVAKAEFPSLVPQGGRSFSEQSVLANPGDRISIAFDTYDSTGIDSITVRLCQILDAGALSCRPVITKPKALRFSRDTVVVELPITGLSSQRFRIQIETKNSLGNAYIWQPLYTLI